MERARRASGSSSTKEVQVAYPGPVEHDWARVVSSPHVFTSKAIHMKNILFDKRRVGARLASICVIAASACTTYTPLRLADVSSGYNVRVSLTDEGAVDLEPKIGPRAR